MVYLLDLSGVYCEPVEPRLLRLLAEESGEPVFYLSEAFHARRPLLKAEGAQALEAPFPRASRLCREPARPPGLAFPEPFHLVSDLPPPEGVLAYHAPDKLEALALALEALGLAPGEAVYWDDNPLWVERARGLGVRAELFLP